MSWQFSALPMSWQLSPSLLGDVFLKVLHDDPRWEVLLDKVGLLQYWREMH